jgi:DNA excision repair protein ERCC-5
VAEMRSLVYADCVVGVPYVLAPSEAEAQCAELERLKLVDGTITDDCDVFLFGGRHVFKNIFSDKKFVEWHVIDNIEKELLLNREKLIMMGLLLGCDYFEGVRGVGIVNAIEILRAFPSVACLREFRNWVYSGTARPLPHRVAPLMLSGVFADGLALIK